MFINKLERHLIVATAMLGLVLTQLHYINAYAQEDIPKDQCKNALECIYDKDQNRLEVIKQQGVQVNPVVFEKKLEELIGREVNCNAIGQEDDFGRLEQLTFENKVVELAFPNTGKETYEVCGADITNLDISSALDEATVDIAT